MKVDDNVRIKVLSALFKEGAIEPNYSHIAKISGLDIKTVRNSLYFLEKEGIVKEYIPEIDSGKLGFRHRHINVVQFEFENEKQQQQMLERIKKEIPNVYIGAECDGPNLMNNLFIGIYRSSYDRYSKIKKIAIQLGLRKHLKNKMSIPFFKRYHHSPGKVVIDILKKEKGL